MNQVTLFEQFARQGDGWGGVEHQGNAFAAAYLGEMNDGFYRDFELGEDHSCLANRGEVGVDVGCGDEGVGAGDDDDAVLSGA